MKRFLTIALLPLLAVPLAASTAAELPSLKDVAKKIAPSVVNLSVDKDVKGYGFGMGRSGDPLMDQFFGRFFGEQGQREQMFKQRSLGSGVILDAAKGIILTNNHVVDDADHISVRLRDKRELEATVLGRDPKTDLAVVKLKHPPADLQAAPFGDSDAMEVGDWVLAVGSPFGLEQTVSHGIISARGRAIGAGPYDDFLQTDAPINPGNSGGPLVDLEGRVVGINTAITSRSGGSEGIGFAIPSNLARRVYAELAEKGHVTRGWLGVQIQDLDGPLARQFGLDKEAKGVVVADVMESGPAHEAGLRAGDVILRYDGRALDSAHELQRVVAETPVGSQVELEVWRDKAPKSLKLKIADMADYDSEGTPAGGSGEDKAPRLGLQVRALSSEEAQVRRLDRGVVVESVEDGSPAERAGLRPHDIILELDQARITSPAELARLAGKLKAGDAAIVRIQRGGRSLYLTIQLDEK
jgi:serine protease Do